MDAVPRERQRERASAREMTDARERERASVRHRTNVPKLVSTKYKVC